MRDLRLVATIALLLAASCAPPDRDVPHSSKTTTVRSDTAIAGYLPPPHAKRSSAKTVHTAHPSLPELVPPPAPQTQPEPRTLARSNEADIRDKIAREYGDLNPARHAWNPPHNAKLYERRMVTYRIAPKGTPGNVTDNLEGTPQTFAQNVSARMKAQLVGPGFDVEPHEATERTLLPGQAVEWTWWITPTGSGPQALQLQTALVLDYGSGDRDVPLPARTQMVDVGFSAAGWARVHWQLLFGTILVPLGGWACKECWQRLRK